MVKGRLVQRRVEPRVLEALDDTPVVIIQGARQVGKSTLATQVIERLGGRMVSLDQEATRRAALLDPDGFVSDSNGLVCIDEIQRAPELLLAIKAEVDRDRRPGRFLLTGSADLVQLRSVGDSLAGRVETIELFGFSQDELGGAASRDHQPVHFVDGLFAAPLRLGWTSTLTRADYLERACAGGFPEALERVGRRRTAWFANYVRQLVERDAPDLADRQRLGDLPKLLRLIAARNATELNQTDLASDAGFPASTLPRYLDIIEYLYLMRRVPSWSTNLTTRVVGRPKTYLTDCGLAAHLLGLSPSSMSSTVDPTSAGALLEAFVVNELHQQQGWGNEQCSIYHYRDRTGPEADVVIEHVDGRAVAIEVKAGMSLGNKPTKWLSLLRDRLGSRFVAGVVLYTGQEALPLGDRLAAMPIEALWRGPSFGTDRGKVEIADDFDAPLPDELAEALGAKHT